MIEKIGIELEGGWEDEPVPLKDAKGAEIPVQIIADLSIDGRTLASDSYMKSNHVGEIVSPPLLLSEWKTWITQYYPSEVNNTCGLHVHISLSTKREYALLMSKSFERRVLNAARVTAERLSLPDRHYIWSRLQGDNPFAHFNIMPSEQTPITEKRIGMRARYAAINFCYSMHGTLEYRVLPMFHEGVDIAITFIDSFLCMTERELREKGRGQLFEKSCALAEQDGVIEEREVL